MPTERNLDQKAANRVPNRFDASPGLVRVRQRAEADRTVRFCNLFHFLKGDRWRRSFYQLKRIAAPGLDERTWYDYEQTLEERFPQWERELQVGRYRATPAKRTYIEKDDLGTLLSPAKALASPATLRASIPHVRFDAKHSR